MFKILIAGKTMKELKENIREFLNELNDENTFDDGQGLPEFNVPVPMTPAQEERAAVVAPIPPTPAGVKDDLLEFGVDSRNLPWDARIHAVTQGKNKDGTWRNRRGVEQTVIDQVEAELRAKMGGLPQEVAAPVPPPVPVPAAPIAPPPPAPVAPPVAPVAPVLSVVPPVALPPVAPPPMPAPAPLPAAHTFDTFKANMPAVLVDLVNKGKLTQDYIGQLKAHFKVDEIWKVNEEQMLAMFENFVNCGLVQKV